MEIIEQSEEERGVGNWLENFEWTKEFLDWANGLIGPVGNLDRPNWPVGPAGLLTPYPLSPAYSLSHSRLPPPLAPLTSPPMSPGRIATVLGPNRIRVEPD